MDNSPPDKIDPKRILRAGIEQAQVMTMAGHVQGMLWTVVPAAIGAVSGKLSSKFSASTGFVWGAIGGIVASVVYTAMKIVTVANWKRFERTHDYELLHDKILEKADKEIVTENETSGNHAQRVIDSRKVAANEIKTL